MTTKLHSLLAMALLGLAVLVALSGCGGGGQDSLFLNVSQRAGWAPIVGGRLAVASYGGNGLLYLYGMTDAGKSITLLTPSLNDANNLFEGGRHPAFSPDGATLAFVSRRGPSEAIYTMNSVTGDRAGVVKITDDSGLGADSQPSWSPAPDATKLIYSSTRANGLPSIFTARSDGSGGITSILADGFSYEWPGYNPTNPDQIVVQSDRDPANADDTDLFIYTISTAGFSKIADSDFVDGAPAWSPDGTKIAFHSNRTGDYDIWVYTISGGALTHITNDARSDGFPVWNLDGSRLAFTRDRELWSCAANGTDQKQITKRF